LTNDAKFSSRVVRWLVEYHPDSTDQNVLERWFNHHTLQRVRLAGSKQISLKHADPKNAWFDQAIGQLEPQQREAWVLDVGERYAVRQIGIAMDCSQTAAANHLSAARRMLQTVAGDELDAQSTSWAERYRQITLIDDVVPSGLSRRRRRRVLRKARRWVVWLTLVLFVCVTAWALVISGLAEKAFEQARTIMFPTAIGSTQPTTGSVK